MDTIVAAEHIFDAIALIFVIGLIGSYQVFLWTLARRNPVAVFSNLAAIARVAWVETIMADKSNALLAVQTLRNTTMAATFFASTSILLTIGVLTLSGQGSASALKTTWSYLNMTGSLGPELWMVKLLVLLLMLFFAFYSFSNAIRIYNHVGYMINAQGGTEKLPLSPRQIASELNRGGRYYSLGTRTYYYLIPFVCWLFGPIYFVVAALILVLVMLPRVDLTPRQMRTE